MGVFKRDGNWWVDFADERKKRRRRKVGPNRKQAEQVLDRMKVQVAQRRFLPEQAASETAFSELATEYLAHVAPTLRWERRLKMIVPRWVEFFGDVALRDISTHDVARYVSQRRTMVAAGTVNREVAVVKRMLNLAVSWGKLDRNPLTKYKMLAERNHRERWLTQGETRRLLDELPRHLKPLIVFLFSTGCRRGEAVGLRWEHVYLEQSLVAFVDTKSGARRDVPLNEPVRRMLQALPRTGENVFMYRGKPIGDFRTAWKAACARAGIEPGFRTHDVRHCFASSVMRTGTSLRALQALLGHKTLAMVQRYAHAAPEDLRKAVDGAAIPPDDPSNA